MAKTTTQLKQLFVFAIHPFRVGLHGVPTINRRCRLDEVAFKSCLDEVQGTVPDIHWTDIMNHCMVRPLFQVL